MKEHTADASADEEEITWNEVESLLSELKGTARGLLAQEGNAGTVQTTQLLNSALKRLVRRSPDWREVSWSNRESFFKDAFFTMRRVLIDYARRRAARREVKAGGFESEQVARLTEAGVLNLDRLVDRAVERAELAEAIDQALADLDQYYPGQHLAEIVQHRAFAGLGQKEIGIMIGESADVVRKREHKAYALLHVALADFFQQPGE